MTEPLRWKDSPDAPIGMRELLRSAETTHRMDESAFRRGADRVARLSIFPAAIALGFWAKVAIAGTIGVLSISAAVAVRSQPVDSYAVRGARTAAVVDLRVAPRALAIEGASIAPERASVIPTSAPRGEARAAATRAPPTTSEVWIPEAPPRPASTLAEELSLLERARSELARSPATALARLDEHRARYPASTLAAERNLMELDALRRTGRAGDARERADAWLAREPGTIYGPRIRALRDGS